MRRENQVRITPSLHGYFFGCSGVDLNIAREVDVATVKKFGKASLVPIAGNEENGHEDAFADPGTNSCQG